MRDGCTKADDFLGHKSACSKCPLKPEQCPYGDRPWSSPQARYPGRILTLWYEGKSVQEITAETGASERTVKRWLRELSPPSWGPEFRAWRNRMVLERYNEGRPVAELVKIFKLSRRQIYRVLKEESGKQPHDVSRPVASALKTQHTRTKRSEKLSAMPGYDKWQIYKKFIKWLEEADLSAVMEGKASPPPIPDIFEDDPDSH
jgi:AraC-like DNA-binding protein